MSEVVKEGQSGIPEIIAPKEVMALIAALRGDVPEKLRRLFAACERNAKRAGQLQELVNGVGRMGYDDYRALLEYIRKARSVKKAEEPTGLSDPLIQTTVERDHPTLLPIIERLLAVRNSLPTMAASGDQPPETHFLSEAALLTRLVFPAATNALNAEAKSEVSSFHDAARPSTIYFGNRNDPSICIVIGENKGGTIRISGKWYEYAGGERKNEVTSEAEVPAEGACFIGRSISLPSLIGVDFPEPLDLPVQCKMGGSRASRGGIMVVHVGNRRYIYNCGSQNNFRTEQGSHIVFFAAERDVSEIIQVSDSEEQDAQGVQAPEGNS